MTFAKAIFFILVATPPGNSAMLPTLDLLKPPFDASILYPLYKPVKTPSVAVDMSYAPTLPNKPPLEPLSKCKLVTVCPNPSKVAAVNHLYSVTHV